MMAVQYPGGRQPSTPEQRDKTDRMRNILEVINFGAKLKKRMQDLGKTYVQLPCPSPAHIGQSDDATQPVHPYMVVARLVPSRRSNGAVHFACTDPNCYYRMME